MTGTAIHPDSRTGLIHSSEEEALREALESGFSLFSAFPYTLENAFRNHLRAGSANLLRSSVYVLFAIYLLVVVPICLFSEDPALPTWQTLAMLPIGAVLAGIWLTSRFTHLDQYVETTLGISLFVCLSGTLYCSMLLGNSYFGLMASYETIYILIIAFSILRLPALVALRYATAAFCIALLVAIFQVQELGWLNMLLYFGVPLIICTINGFMLEYSERRSYLQNQLLNMESQRLAGLQHEAQRQMEKQQLNSRFLALIAGNLSTSELCSRTLKFLIDETSAVVGAAYVATGPGKMRLTSQWGGNPRLLEQRQNIVIAETLLGPAFASQRPLEIREVPEGYLPIKAGSGEYRPGVLLIVPVMHNGEAVAALELARFDSFAEDTRELMDAITLHFAYAMIAALARQRALAGQELAVAG